ncbi:MAG: CRISPR-associated endonuclease Cas3'' [Candidatus Contendobacter sp.]|nr:CRISPR-associated endonuclease Cas3'' [Candidatus Contendobacter sp.]MDG4557788.1 CRISPR-associated endonuclease Cas3'' [Candidatus Contendobacter sp.]
MSSKISTFLAHVRQDTDGRWLPHSLDDHLRSVAVFAQSFAAAFGAGDWARLAGLWHDLGKYRPAFQRYIRGASGYDAHIETAPGKVDHSTAGALHAMERMKGLGRILAYLIAGHHAGLPDWQSAEKPASSLIYRLKQTDFLAEALAQSPPADILDASLPTSTPGQRDYALWIRLLFSCLVDADFLDTEQFMAPDKAVLRGQYPLLEELEPRFDAYMAALSAKTLETPVNRMRAVVLDRCRNAAEQTPGLFSLTVPTGGGKTLASLAFALRHARHHGKRRIFYVIPYTSIIEQTAEVFRGVFGEDAVLEHHSNFDSERETPRSRVACENWDASLIVTTNVQFFESLFAARPSRTRKLHNILDSVVILDEAQLLPPDFLTPILGAIRELSRHYGVSFVLCTATQPALASQRGFDWRFDGLDDVREIVGDAAAVQELHAQLRRVEVALPEDLQAPTSWETLATELETFPRALCIVDRRDDARILHGLLPTGTVHLSGLMCGQHRSDVIAMIKARLAAGEPIRVVSTQLVEAGVDLDFPVVYRALSGLDSIAQAAGRCNREGRCFNLGRVVVFVPPTQPPVGHLRQARDAGRQVLQRRPPDPLVPNLFAEYFQSLYWRKGAEGLDRQGIMALLKNNNRFEFSFRTAAERFQLIPEMQAPVIVRYGDNERLLARLARPGDEVDRKTLRRLQRYVVNIPRRIHQRLLADGAIEEQWPGVYVQIAPLYDPEVGLRVEPAVNYAPDDLIA